MATRDLSTAVDTKLEDNTIYPFYAVEFLFDTSPLRLWTGQGDLTIGGNTYTGSGSLLGVETIEETSEIAVRGATLTLSGVPSEIASLALQTPYQGRTCTIYFGLTDKTDLTEIFSGYMDEMNIDEGPETSSIEVKVENKLIDLERARVRRFTSGYQKSKYPGDKGFDFVESIQDKEVVWGRKAGN